MAVAISTITTTVQEIQGAGDVILKVLEGLPAIGSESAAALGVLDIVSQLLQAGLKALQAAQGQVITVAAVQALLPDQTPLIPPRLRRDAA